MPKYIVFAFAKATEHMNTKTSPDWEYVFEADNGAGVRPYILHFNDEWLCGLEMMCIFSTQCI